MSSLRHGASSIAIWMVVAVLSLEAQTVPGAAAAATVVRDVFGQPHVTGTTDEAAFYAFGRTQMRDFPVTVAMNLAGSSGELARFVGAGPGKFPGVFAAGDVQRRAWRIPALAAAEEVLLPSADRALLDAYVLGLNDERQIALANAAALANRTRPFFFSEGVLIRLLSRPMTVIDVIANGFASNGYSSMTTADGLASGALARESAIRTHSNGWLVRGEKTASGATITLADPHTSFERHGQFRAYFAEISGPGYSAAGISVPGMPGIGIGFTPGVSWVQTSNSPDIVDVWVAVEEPDGLSYLEDGVPIPILRATAWIDVYDEKSGLVTPFAAPLAWAGDLEAPILAESTGPDGVTKMWFARASFTSAPAYWSFLFALGRARTVAEALAAFDMNAAAYGNYLIADTAGATGYIWSGRVPVRGAPTPGTDWSMVQDGSKIAYRWQGFHAALELPREFVAAGAGIEGDAAWVQANNAADRVRAHPSIDDSNFPEYMVHAGKAENYRSLRAAELLRAPGLVLDFAKNEAIAFDDENQWMRRVRPFVHAVIKDLGLDVLPEVAAIDQRLANWDLRMNASSDFAVIAELIHGHYEQYVPMLADLGLYPHVATTFAFPDEVPPLADFRSGYAWSWNRIALAVAVYQTAMEATKLLNRRLVTDFDLPPFAANPHAFAGFDASVSVWGTTHFFDLGGPADPFGFAIYPTPGSEDTLFTATVSGVANAADGMIYDLFLFGEQGHFLELPVTDGSHALLEVEMSVPPRARTLAALGPTEITDSPRRYSRAADFCSGRFADFPTGNGVIASDPADIENYAYGVN